MPDIDSAHTLPRPKPPPVLYPLKPRGFGTPEVESLYSYLLSLAGEHSLPPQKLLDHLATLPAWSELGHALGRYWDEGNGAEVVGRGNVAQRWAGLLKVATGIDGLESCTLVGLSRFVCGIGLVSQTRRVCLACLSADQEAGALPYERLWWRFAAAKCCPTHYCYLVEPECDVVMEKSPVRVPRRAGVCGRCGSIGYRCHVPEVPEAMSDPTPNPTETWISEQVRTLVMALPLLAKADHRYMKDQLAHYCAAGAGRGALAQRANMTKSQMSYWLRKPDARTSLGQLIDIALVEQFDLTQLMLGNLMKMPIPGKRDPRRVKRKSRRVDHAALQWHLKAALAQGKKISKVASEVGVDISTLAKHEELYLALRERTQDELDSADTERRKKAVEEAEMVLEVLVNDGLTPSLRAAGDLTGTTWYPAQLRAMSLAVLRAKLGDERVTVPPRWFASSWEYRNMVEASSRRLREKLGFTASRPEAVSLLARQLAA